MSDLVNLSREGEVAFVTVNNPPVNALSPGVPEGIAQCVAEIASDPEIKVGILIGAGDTFIAGADIKEFGKITAGKKDRGVGLVPILDAIENCPKPIVCAIHGTAFGGGLETAMACHYRVGLSTAKVGQPEVKLGLIPGAAGTQRLPRLVGIPKAAEMCAFGEPIGAIEAHHLGIFDAVTEGDLRTGALEFARRIIADGRPARRTRDIDYRMGDPDHDRAALQQLREKAKKISRGSQAPLRAIDAVEAALLPFEEGCAREAEIFRDCLYSTESKAMIHLFFGERAVNKIPDLPKNALVREVRRAAVVGAGTMGGGIAMTYANAGIPVILKEVDQERLDRGMQAIEKNYQVSVDRGKLTREEKDRRLSLITPATTYDAFDAVDIVVEAVFEDLKLKQQIFGEIDEVAREGAILASNTSTLNIDAIAAATRRPYDVIGHHFFSPANVMRLLEIVRGKATSPSVIASSMALARKLRKVGVLVGNCFGFVGNRMYAQYQREAQFLVEEGCGVEDVDRALVAFGMAMGPLAVGDLSGLDVGYRIRKEHKHLYAEGRRAPLIADRLVEQGRHGQKTGAGYYKYETGSRAPIPDPEVDCLAESIASEQGLARRKASPEEIIERTMYALVNEGARILEEGIALRAVDIDVIYVNGYGYPTFRGGPMFYADAVGLPAVVEKIAEFQELHGEQWAPAPLLLKLAAEGMTFVEFDRSKGAAI